MITDRGAAFLPALEAEIQKRAHDKDPKFILSELFPDKIVFVRMQDGFRVCRVDEEWVRNNLSAIYTHGGHGFVHEFIPVAPIPEIWVSNRHPPDCVCKNVRPDRKMSEDYSNRTVRHEMSEFKEMASGTIFVEAHERALKEEIAEGHLNPYCEVAE